MKKTVCFGEILLRLTPEGATRFVQAERFSAIYGGSEANVAVSLCEFGTPAAFVSRVPDNAIGQAAINSLRRYGVDTVGVRRGGERLGIYFLENGASQRPSGLIYDRRHSAIAEAQATDFDWETAFADADWFHFSGITPALSPETAAATLAAVRAAKAHGLTVSCDLNYRANLWTQAEARQTMGALMPYVDVIIGTEEDADDTLDLRLEGDDYAALAAQICAHTGAHTVALIRRDSLSATENRWRAMMYDGEASYSREYQIHLVDCVGGGDAFSAGVIYALKAGMSRPAVLEFATAASCLKYSLPGDANHVSAEEAMTLAGGDGSGLIKR